MKELQSVTFSKKCACSKMTKELQSVKRNDYLQYITIYCHQFWKVLFLYRSHCQYSFVDTWFCVFIFSIFYIEPKGKIVQAKTNLFKKACCGYIVTLYQSKNMLYLDILLSCHVCSPSRQSVLLFWIESKPIALRGELLYPQWMEKAGILHSS